MSTFSSSNHDPGLGPDNLQAKVIASVTDGLSFKLHTLGADEALAPSQVELILMDQIQVIVEHATRTMVLVLFQQSQAPAGPCPAILLDERGVVRLIWQAQNALAELRLRPIASRCPGSFLPDHDPFPDPNEPS